MSLRFFPSFFILSTDYISFWFFYSSITNKVSNTDDIRLASALIEPVCRQTDCQSDPSGSRRMDRFQLTNGRIGSKLRSWEILDQRHFVQADNLCPTEGNSVKSKLNGFEVMQSGRWAGHPQLRNNWWILLINKVFKSLEQTGNAFYRLSPRNQ